MKPKTMQKFLKTVFYSLMIFGSIMLLGLNFLLITPTVYYIADENPNETLWFIFTMVLPVTLVGLIGLYWGKKYDKSMKMITNNS